MKSNAKILSLLVIGILLLSACGGGQSDAPPTISAEQMQGTAVSAALTIVAETQAAIPTNTPLPPTETPTQTPLPTNTLPPIPTLAFTLTNTPASAGGDYCATRVLGKPLGRETVIKIDNKVKAAVTVSLYLNETADKNECGYRSYQLAKNGSVVITDLVQGCYNLWAWSNDPKNTFNSAGYGCINNPDKWTFEITKENIKFVGP